MRKALAVFVALSMFVGCDFEATSPQDSKYALVDNAEKEFKAVYDDCQDGKVDNTSLKLQKKYRIAVARALTNTEILNGYTQIKLDGGNLVKVSLTKVYNCLNDSLETSSYALTSGKADDGASVSVDMGEVNVAGVGGLEGPSIQAQADSETIAVILTSVKENAQATVGALAELSQCLTVIGDCIMHVGLENAWCMQDAHELHPGNANCAEGCCSHTSMVGLVHCLPSCGGNWVDEDAFDQCRYLTPADDGYCGWW